MLSKRTTVYIETELHKALKIKALEMSRSVSDLVNSAIRVSLEEDAEDLKSFDERIAEPLVSYDDMLKRLKKDGRL